MIDNPTGPEMVPDARRSPGFMLQPVHTFINSIINFTTRKISDIVLLQLLK
jgi:hypothetical protein